MKYGLPLVFLLAACSQDNAAAPDRKAAAAKKLPQVHYYSLGRS